MKVWDEPPKPVVRLYRSIKRWNFRYGIVRWNFSHTLHDWIKNRGYIIRRSPFKRCCGTKDFFLAYGTLIMRIEADWQPMKYLITGNVAYVDRDEILPSEFEVFTTRDVKISDIRGIEYSKHSEPVVKEFLRVAKAEGYEIPAKLMEYPLSDVVRGVENRAAILAVTEYEINTVFPRKSYIIINGSEVILQYARRPMYVFLGWLWNEDHGFQTPDKFIIEYETYGVYDLDNIIRRRVEERVSNVIYIMTSRKPQPRVVNDVVKSSIKFLNKYLEYTEIT